MRKKSSKNKTLVCTRFINEFQASQAAKSSKKIKGCFSYYFGILVLNKWPSVYKKAFCSKRLTSSFPARILPGSLVIPTGRIPTRIQHDHEALSSKSRISTRCKMENSNEVDTRVRTSNLLD